MARGIKKKLAIAQKNLLREMSAFAERGFFARGLANEGYHGGYHDALSDVILLLNGISPKHRNRHYWEKQEGIEY